jgi:hypothetical protein
MNVWTYWAGPMPWWIQRCLSSMEAKCVRSRFNLLTPDNVPADIPLPARWRRLPAGVGTDALRAALLATRGGLWLDADTVLIKDPASLFASRRADKAHYCVWPTSPRRVVAGYIYSPADHPVARRWLAGVQAALHHAENIGWGEMGEQLITPAVQMCPGYTWELPAKTFLPVDFDSDPAALFRSGDPKAYQTGETVAFGLNYSWMKEHGGVYLTPEAVAEGSLLVQRLLRNAI